MRHYSQVCCPQLIDVMAWLFSLLIASTKKQERARDLTYEVNWNKPRQTGRSNAQRILKSSTLMDLKDECKHSGGLGNF
jgi:hypothetical protein